MGMYRDSQLGLCIDLNGPDGNIWVIWGIGADLAMQLDREDEWRQAVEAGKRLGGSYLTHLNIFKEFFPIVTLIGYDEVAADYERRGRTTYWEKEDGPYTT